MGRNPLIGVAASFAGVSAGFGTNIVTPVMTYAGVILLFCRRYRPQFTIGDLALMMTPYAGVFLVVATTVMLLWFKLGIPFGF